MQKEKTTQPAPPPRVKPVLVKKKDAPPPAQKVSLRYRRYDPRNPLR